MIPTNEKAAALEKAYAVIDRLKKEIGKVVCGKEKETELLICAVIAGGTCL